MDDFRFRSQRSPRDDTTTSTSAMSLVTPPRNSGRMPLQPQQQLQQGSVPDIRSNLPRRFTTESGRVPTLSNMSLTSPQRGPDLSQDYNSSYNKIQLIEKKKMEYERIRQQRQRFELEMQKLDQEYRKEAQELAMMEEDIMRAGHQSEPTTPPEHNSGFPSLFSRPSRYSMSSLASPPGFPNRPARSGSHLISPPSGLTQGARYGWGDTLPSRSVPTTRRNSDDDERDEAFQQELSNQRSSHTHRYSMPSARSRNGAYETGLDHANVTRFLFDEEDGAGSGNHNSNNGSSEKFPTLVRREDQMSLSTINGQPANNIPDTGTLGHRPAALRHSLDLKYISENPPDTGMNGSSNMSTAPKLQSSYSSNDVPTVKSGSGQAGGQNNNSGNNAANNHAQQHFHNHNASMGRIPAGAMPTRGHSREMSADNSHSSGREQPNTFQSLQSALQASAPPFGPSNDSHASMHALQMNSPPSQTPVNSFGGYYPPPPFVPANASNAASGNYGMNMLNSGMQQMNLGAGQNPNHGTAGNLGSGMNNMGNVGGMNGMPQMPQMPNMNGMGNMNNMYPNGQNFAQGYGQMPYNQAQPAQPVRDSQARVIQHRRQMDSEAMSRFNSMTLESCRGQIYELCKDQHGCRFLQKKLEERDEDQVHTIWLETHQHVIELMTDPFGNYLCQKLLEFCNEEDRTVLIHNASQDLVRIALNTHGTRALQKMIEHVGTPQQVLLIIEALRYRVVDLIQDLNGNHVIQKCLNKLSAADSQFIFDAVGHHVVEVGTHRHGCCVLQRCIDHAKGDQKLWLIERITEHCRVLVQDPFGNYVVQYIIDINEPTFTEPIVAMFQGCISQLSRHKFSSNVIEKCLRCSQGNSKDMIVEEMLHPQEMERLIRDNYGNYVVQTALEYATPHMKHRLVEAIRPVLPTIRNTPYGRRIQAKVSNYDSSGNASASGQVTPADNTQGQIPLRQSHSRGLSHSGSIGQSQGGPVTNGGGVMGSQPSEPAAMNSYQNGGMMRGSAAPGGPVQQPQYNQQGVQGHGNSAPQPGHQGAQQSNGGPWM